MKRSYRDGPLGDLPKSRPHTQGPGARAKDARQPESLIELLTRDLEAWRLARGVITKAKLRG